MYKVRYLLKLCNVIKNEANKILSNDVDSLRVVEIFMRLDEDDELIELIAVREDGVEIPILRLVDFDDIYKYVTRNVINIVNYLVDKVREI